MTTWDDIDARVATFQAVLETAVLAVENETKARRKSVCILIGVLVAEVVLALVIAAGFRLQHDSQQADRQRTANAVCQQTNRYREALRTVIAKEATSTEAALSVGSATLGDVSMILHLAVTPAPGETAAQKQAATAFLATADASIGATVQTATGAALQARQATVDLVRQFPDLKCG